jgi:hypothetical protein
MIGVREEDDQKKINSMNSKGSKTSNNQWYGVFKICDGLNDMKFNVLQRFIINQRKKFEIDERSVIIEYEAWKLLDWEKPLSLFPYYWMNIARRLSEPESSDDRQALKNIWCHVGRNIRKVDPDEGLLLMEATIQEFKKANQFCKEHQNSLYKEAERIIENIAVSVYGEKEGKYFVRINGEMRLTALEESTGNMVLEEHRYFLKWYREKRSYSKRFLVYKRR